MKTDHQLKKEKEKVHGFIKRMRTKVGRNVIRRRRAKGGKN